MFLWTRFFKTERRIILIKIYYSNHFWSHLANRIVNARLTRWDLTLQIQRTGIFKQYLYRKLKIQLVSCQQDTNIDLNKILLSIKIQPSITTGRNTKEAAASNIIACQNVQWELFKIEVWAASWKLVITSYLIDLWCMLSRKPSLPAKAQN